MILSIRGFSEGLYKKLKVVAAIEGVTIGSIVTEAMEKRLSGITVPVIASLDAPVVVVPSLGEPTSLGDSTVTEVPVVERTTSVGRSEVTEVRPVHAKRKDEWAQGMCPKHGRMAINGKFTCC